MPKNKTTKKNTNNKKDMKAKNTNNKSAKASSSKKEVKERKSFKEAYTSSRDKVWDKKNQRLKLHHSFRRSYREDYARGLKAPGLLAHANTTLKILFKNWKIFGLLMILVVALNIAFVGIMNQETYETVQQSLDESYEMLQDGGELGRFAKSGLLLISTVTTGGLTSGMSEVQQVFLLFFIAITWLITIYFLRHLMAGNKPKFRDGIFNALTPLMSSFCILALIFVHLLPILFCVIVYSSAASTGFLEQPLYAFLFWVFCGLLGLLSFYLLPVSITSLVAISVPGMYPMTAVHASTDLMQGRRTKFIIRLLFALLYLAIIWVVIMLPIIWLDLILKENVDFFAEIPVVSFFLQLMTTFTIIYLTSYIYLFYRRMLDDAD